jgi:hypothetical protein
MQKAGTTWLFDQLLNHPDFWMPPVKELHYFTSDFPRPIIQRNMQRFFTHREEADQKRIRNGFRPLDERDQRFFETVKNGTFGGRLEPYFSLFAMKGDQLSGDITPSYSTLDEATISTLAVKLPHLKVALLVRDPVERVWSQWRMWLSKSERQANVDPQDIKKLEKFLERPEVQARSFPTRTAKAWQAPFGDRFRVYFFDDIAERPDWTSAQIVSFFGGRSEVPATIEASFNRSKRADSGRSPEVQALMRQMFEAEREACARTFGGQAERWPAEPY